MGKKSEIQPKQVMTKKEKLWERGKREKQMKGLKEGGMGVKHRWDGQMGGLRHDGKSFARHFLSFFKWRGRRSEGTVFLFKSPNTQLWSELILVLLIFTLLLLCFR